jgi:hypothetical protein
MQTSGLDRFDLEGAVSEDVVQSVFRDTAELAVIALPGIRTEQRGS